MSGQPAARRRAAEAPTPAGGTAAVGAASTDHPPDEGALTVDEPATGKPGAIEVVIRRVDRFQQEHGVLGFPFAVVQKFGNDQAGGKATLIAYYGLFALFPLLMLFTTILGYVLDGNTQLHNQLIDSALGSFPIIGPQLKSQVHGVSGSTGAVVFSSLLLLYGAIGLGLATQSAMNGVWNIPYVRWPMFALRYLRAFAVLVLLALSTIGTTVLTGFATLASRSQVSTVLLLVGSLVLNFVLILIAFMVMTADRLTWRDVALGAVLAAIFWQAMQLLGSWYIGRELQNRSEIYGFFGIVIVLLTWIFLGAQLFLLAAEINVVKRHRLWPRSMTQPPLTAADKVVFDRLAQMEIRRPEVQLEVSFLPEADRDPLASTERERD